MICPPVGVWTRAVDTERRGNCAAGSCEHHESDRVRGAGLRRLLRGNRCCGHVERYVADAKSVRRFPNRSDATDVRTVMKITGSLVVCVTAAAFTATVLLINPDPAPSPAATAVAAAPGAPPTITISQFAFNSVTASPGATVAVNNLDGVEHTVTAADGAFDSGVLATGGVVGLVAPTTPGVYSFLCAIHPSMSGQLTVQTAAQP